MTDSTHSHASDSAALAPAVRVNDVGFSWSKNLPPVLEGFSLGVEAGSRVLIGGPSGTGKTTLLGLLAGVLVPSQGTVTLLGTGIGHASAAKRDAFRADHLGYVFQQFNLVPYLSVLENVTLACRFSRRRRERAGHPESEAKRLLEHLGMQDRGLLQRRVTELSVGQQQRVAAARALIGHPEILIADEPTSALDPDNREAFLSLLFDECTAQGTTVLFVSHDRSLSGMFDRCVMLSENGSPSQSMNPLQGGESSC